MGQFAARVLGLVGLVPGPLEWMGLMPGFTRVNLDPHSQAWNLGPAVGPRAWIHEAALEFGSMGSNTILEWALRLSL